MNKSIKKVFLYLSGGIILLSVGLNINKQFGILWGARGRNEEVRKEIEKLTKENTRMKQEIEYATSSAFVDRQARKSFGLGGENDYWLILPEEKELGELFPQVNMGGDKTKFQQWLDLFR